jgi:hypothetical protein
VYVFVCVCVSVYRYICRYIYIYTCTHTHTHTHIRVFASRTNLCVCVCECVYACVFMHFRLTRLKVCYGRREELGSLGATRKSDDRRAHEVCKGDLIFIDKGD